MNRKVIEGTIRAALLAHEQIHDEKIVEREELVQVMTDGIIQAVQTALPELPPGVTPESRRERSQFVCGND